MDAEMLAEIKKVILAQGDAFEAFKKQQEERFNEVDAFVAKSQRPGAGGFAAAGDQDHKAAFHVEIDGKKVPVLSKSARLADHFASQSVTGSDDFSIGEYVRDVMTGRKAASSSALVPTYVGAQVIDDVRAATTVVRAGSGTIAIDGPTNLAKITGDAVVYEHAEAANDISESDITLAAVALNPKALVALIPLTMEVVADSPNLDAVLRTSLAAAFGAKLDALSLATILADTAIPDSAAGQDPAIWAKCLEAVGAAMAVNQPLPSAMICNTSDFIARASQLASTAGSWLGKPPVLSGMAELPTTGIVAGKAIYGGFERSFAVALRNELRLEVVRWGKATSGSHMLIAYMRGAGVVLQPKGLFIQLKTVV